MECYIDSKNSEQNKENRHHDPVGFLDTLTDTKHQDDHTNEQRNNLPAIISKGTGHLPEFCSESICVRWRQSSSGEGTNHIFQNPSHDNSIADSHGKGAEYRNVSKKFSCTAVPFDFTRITKCIYRTGAGCSPKTHFADDSGKTDQCHKKKIRKQIGTASVHGDSGWKHPDIAHTHGRADTGQNKSPFIVKRISFFHLLLVPRIHKLNVSMIHDWSRKVNEKEHQTNYRKNSIPNTTTQQMTATGKSPAPA